MARTYCRIATRIWRDPDFRALSGAAQRLYLQLITQPDITAVGLLPMTVRRWASAASDATEETVAASIKELDQARFVVADEDTEELLIRTFVKWDNGYTNPKRLKAILAATTAITSRAIGYALYREFARLGLPTDGLPDSPSGRASDSPSDSPRVVVTSVVEESTTRNPQSVPASPGSAVALRDDAVVDAEIIDQPTAQTLIAEWIDHCARRPPKNVIGQIAKHVGALLEEGFDYADVRRALQLWQDKGLHPSTLPSVVHEVVNTPAASGRATGATAARPSTTDAAVRAGLDLAAKYAAQGE